MLDWNWFFSSLAQSVAAIVGILAAFAITSLVSNQAEFKRQLGRGEDLLARCHQIADALSGRYFSWYNKHSMTELLDSVRADLRDGLLDGTRAEGFLKRHPHSPFVPREEVLLQVEERIAFEEAEGSRPPSAFPFGPVPRSFLVPDLPAKLEDEREAIDGLIVEARHNARLVSQYIGSVHDDPEDSPIVRFSIAACVTLFLGAVVYPLSFLPAQPAPGPQLTLQAVVPALLSLRGALLSFTSVVFLSVCVVFFRLSRRLRYPQHLREQLSPFRQLSSYSKYLAIMAANEEAQRKNV